MEKKQGTAKTYFDTSDMKYLNLLQNLCKRTYRRLLTIFDISSSLYPELFQILWQSTLPCFGHDGSDHMLLDCLVGEKHYVTNLDIDYHRHRIVHSVYHLVNSIRVSISYPFGIFLSHKSSFTALGEENQLQRLFHASPNGLRHVLCPQLGEGFEV